jgi:hypothetical protein
LAEGFFDLGVACPNRCYRPERAAWPFPLGVPGYLVGLQELPDSDDLPLLAIDKE